MKTVFTKKDVLYNLRTSNFLILRKINTKRFDLYSFTFRVSQLWNQLPDHITYETSVKVSRISRQETGEKSIAYAQSAVFRTGNI